jgi:hypothetical protein
MNSNQDCCAKEARLCEELAKQLAAACQEVVDARAKALVDAEALERLRGEWDQLVGTMDELHGKLEVIDQERDAAVCLSKEQEEQARVTHGNLAGKILLLLPSDCRLHRRGVFDFPS